ncbi:MAG: DUF5103 domain-containing protein [Bacteroidota bacterium]
MQISVQKFTKQFFTFLVFLIFYGGFLFAQDTIIEDRIYRENIKSVQLFREGWKLSYPVVELNGNTKLILKFDDLSDEIKTYNYKIVHCDSEWRESQLSPSEYIDGMVQDQINEYDHSFNTYTSYVHYTLSLPNENLSLRLSGNYAIIVYENFDESDIVFVKRFMVYENQVNVEAEITRPILSAYRETGHQINLRINYGSFPVEDPYSDIKLVIMQNGRWDNRMDNLRPLFVRNNALVYDNQNELIFPAGNEYRWFDIKSLRYQSPYIKDISYEAGIYTVDLFAEENRANKSYFYEEDINGKYYIEVQEESNNYTDAEYVYVNFELPVEAPELSGGYYVFGELTNWNLLEENKMEYDWNTSSYKLRLFLKQGYYNYHIAFAEENSGKANLSFVEGNNYETENNYLIFVYHYGTASRYERLIGYQLVNSLRRK